MKTAAKWLAITLLGLLASAAAAQTPGVRMVPLGYCQIAAATLASATGLSSCGGGIPTGATMIAMQAETQNIRWRDDGTAPTTAIGMILISGQPPQIYTGTISKLQFIDATAGGLLDVTFYSTP